jgi:hypothetical protein
MSDHSYEDDDWLSALSLNFECLAIDCIVEKNDSYKQNSSNKHDWIKQPRLPKLQRCAAQTTLPNKQPIKDAEANKIIQNEFSAMLMEIDKRYKDTRAKGFALKALRLKPNDEQQEYDKQRSVQEEVIKRMIHSRWVTQYESVSNEHIYSKGDNVVIWNHENDLETAKTASCFFVHVRAVI